MFRRFFLQYGGLLTLTGAPTQNVRLLLGGDILLSRYVWLTAQRRKDPTYPFHKIRQFLEGADIAFANLECVFVENPPFFEDRMVFRTHPSMVEGLKAAGIDIVSTANNHCRDAGSHGLEFTLQHLEKHGIAAVGTALEPKDTTKGTVIERKGVRFGFLAYTFDQRNGNHLTNDARIAMLDESTVGRDVEALRTRCDVVIVSMHAGWEYWTTPNALQQRFAHAAIDGGAAVVAGHHPHVVQPVEEYKGGVIFYSLGNLVFDQAVRKGVREGAIGEVGFHGKQLSWHKLHPITIRDTVPTL